MHSRTTSNVFLHDNLEWLRMASNWSKLSAMAALGVIHKGYFEEGMNILGPSRKAVVVKSKERHPREALSMLLV